MSLWREREYLSGERENVSLVRERMSLWRERECLSDKRERDILSLRERECLSGERENVSLVRKGMSLWRERESPSGERERITGKISLLSLSLREREREREKRQKREKREGAAKISHPSRQPTQFGRDKSRGFISTRCDFIIKTCVSCTRDGSLKRSRLVSTKAHFSTKHCHLQ